MKSIITTVAAALLVLSAAPAAQAGDPWKEYDKEQAKQAKEYYKFQRKQEHEWYKYQRKQAHEWHKYQRERAKAWSRDGWGEDAYEGGW